ncbi:adenosylcobinamide-phosphate synthase CbiB [Marinomonas pollencensis]|uniref:Cobalamin biosynthesis protein CobD n=1 Tax=Marinomonas pollencensis TaxID=491954 RepID=A0A3E0DDA0_9GAMM|nr:adenosylcobinamide-phosphate synthase CbiB [Marinomonas pollencensis]REG79518.1 adenosylcobinamide-phosphate synthase [Marinomonas pollencensis]
MITSIFNDSFEFLGSTAVMLVAALLLDRLLGEPKSWHPLIWFGRWVDYCRRTLQLPLSADVFNQRLLGVAAWCAAVLPCLFVLLLCYWLLPDWLDSLLSVLILYFSIGWQSLREHALAIATPLSLGHLDEARVAVSRIVSRDTHDLSESQVAKAGIESILENGSDAIFAPIFWFLIFGAPGALVYRLANTLDAMWGYKTAEFLSFGWFAARFDDVLNYLPARLVVYTYAICGQWAPALRSAGKAEVRWKSPNAGPVMAAGAGALGVQLGGEAPYFGKVESRPVLGEGEAPTPVHLEKAIWLVDKSVYLWGLLICILI